MSRLIDSIITAISNWFNQGIHGWTPRKGFLYQFYDDALNAKVSGEKWEEIYTEFKMGDRTKIKPYAYINGKKYRARFYLTEDYCKITTKQKKIFVPINRCTFRRKVFSYYQGQANVMEYYITVVARKVTKEDYDRYTKYNKKK